jgi:hypothetical protein
MTPNSIDAWRAWIAHEQMVADGHGMHECASDCPTRPTAQRPEPDGTLGYVSVDEVTLGEPKPCECGHGCLLPHLHIDAGTLRAGAASTEATPLTTAAKRLLDYIDGSGDLDVQDGLLELADEVRNLLPIGGER